MLLELTAQADRPHPGGTQELQLVQPSSTTAYADLSCNPFTLVEVELLFLLWMWETKTHFGKKSGVLFSALLSESLSTGHFYAAAPLCEHQE